MKSSTTFYKYLLSEHICYDENNISEEVPEITRIVEMLEDENLRYTNASIGDDYLRFYIFKSKEKINGNLYILRFHGGINTEAGNLLNIDTLQIEENSRRDNQIEMREQNMILSVEEEKLFVYLERRLGSLHHRFYFEPLPCNLKLSKVVIGDYWNVIRESRIIELKEVVTYDDSQFGSIECPNDVTLSQNVKANRGKSIPFRYAERRLRNNTNKGNKLIIMTNEGKQQTITSEESETKIQERIHITDLEYDLDTATFSQEQLKLKVIEYFE